MSNAPLAATASNDRRTPRRERRAFRLIACALFLVLVVCGVAALITKLPRSVPAWLLMTA
jgi:hypothetical protein